MTQKLAMPWPIDQYPNSRPIFICCLCFDLQSDDSKGIALMVINYFILVN